MTSRMGSLEISMEEKGPGRVNLHGFGSTDKGDGKKESGGKCPSCVLYTTQVWGRGEISSQSAQGGGLGENVKKRIIGGELFLHNEVVWKWQEKVERLAGLRKLVRSQGGQKGDISAGQARSRDRKTGDFPAEEERRYGEDPTRRGKIVEKRCALNNEERQNWGLENGERGWRRDRQRLEKSRAKARGGGTKMKK